MKNEDKQATKSARGTAPAGMKTDAPSGGGYHTGVELRFEEEIARELKGRTSPKDWRAPATMRN